MNETEKRKTCVNLHLHKACGSPNEVFDVFCASCSEAFRDDEKINVANFRIFECVTEYAKIEEAKKGIFLCKDENSIKKEKINV